MSIIDVTTSGVVAGAGGTTSTYTGIASVTNGGAGYTVAPSVTITGGGGSGASAVAILGPSGALTSVTLGSGGSGYTSVPYVTVSGGGSASSAKITAALTSGSVSMLTITEPGSGYTSAPTIGFFGGTGSGAGATASIASGSVRSITVTNGGSAYANPPSVAVSGGGGSGCMAIAKMSGGTVASVLIVEPGTGYTSSPAVTFSGGGATSATATASFTAGAAVAQVIYTNLGTGYTSTPSILLSGGSPTSSATAVGVAVGSNVAYLQVLINGLLLGTGGYPKGGATLRFPSNTSPYYFTNTISFDYSSGSYDDLSRIDIEGDGMGNTQIDSHGLGSSPLFMFKGIGAGLGLNDPDQGYFRIANLRFVGELTSTSTNVGTNNAAISLLMVSYMQIENVSIENFGVGISAADCYNISNSNIDIEACLIGYNAAIINFSAPSAFTFVDSQIVGCPWYGLAMIESGVLNFSGGSIAYNGSNSYSTKLAGAGCGVYIANGAGNPLVSNASWGASFTSVQFEGNNGLADAFVYGDGQGIFETNTGFLFSGCSFLRGSSVVNVAAATYCILLTAQPGTGGTSPSGPPLKEALVVTGCSFNSGSLAGNQGPYVPSSSTPYIQVNEGGGLYQVTTWGNVWGSAVEMPNFRGPVESSAGLASSRVIFNGTGSTGAYCSTNGTLYNVNNVYKNSTGNYTVNFQKSLTDSSYATLGSVAGVGVFSVYVTYPTSVTVQLYNLSGTPTDFMFVSVVTFGSNLLLAGT